MAYSWNTKQTATGFEWAITCTVWNADENKARTEVLVNGQATTRAKAMGIAKKWVLFFRKGGKI